MAAPFSMTLRSLGADGTRRSTAATLVATALVGAWLAWFFLARVAVLETSEQARLEVAEQVHLVEAPVAGRLVATDLAIGHVVSAGALLAELDAEPQRRALEEARALLDARRHERETLRHEAEALADNEEKERRTALAKIEEARARGRSSEADVQLHEAEAARSTRLHEKAIAIDEERERALAEVAMRRAQSQAVQQEVASLEWAEQARESAARLRAEELGREAAALEGAIAAQEAGVKRLEHEVELRAIRAPIAGTLGEVADLRPGAFVHEGEKLGAVVPVSRIRIVAQFTPRAALGRIRRDAPARMELDGFPWTEYGTLGATVASAAHEPRDGQVRVELELVPGEPPRIPLEHGLPGVVVVEVERVSPAVLVFRMAGKLLGAGK